MIGAMIAVAAILIGQGLLMLALYRAGIDAGRKEVRLEALEAEEKVEAAEAAIDAEPPPHRDAIPPLSSRSARALAERLK